MSVYGQNYRKKVDALKKGVKPKAIMSFDERLRAYNTEKQQLLADHIGDPPWELERLHKELRDKWRV